MSHLPLWIAAGLIFLGAVLLMVGLCQMAAMGDRKLERARRDLAGPRGRARVGISDSPARHGRAQRPQR